MAMLPLGDLFHPPFTDPVLIFALATVIFIVAPRIADRFRIPGIIGIIVSGIIVGPHGLRLLDRGPVIVLLGTVGLMYLMFLAGAEMDLHGFRRTRSRSAIFGALTFALPLAGALIAGLLLGYPPRTTILLGALFATQTLVAYPLVLRYRIGHNEAVTVTLGATIITDTAVLLVLAVIAAGTEGRLDLAFWPRLLLPLLAVSAGVAFGWPVIGRWFLRRSEAGGHEEFLFITGGLFSAAVLAQLAGVEPILGAFLAGLALNPLLPATGLLANRVRFVGEAIFIPFFLLSVGMLVDVPALLRDPQAWGVMVLLLAIAVAAKWAAAMVAQRLFGFSTAQGRTMFGLSVSHAAAMMAVALVGYDVGIFNDLIVNTAILTILVSSLIGAAVVGRAGRELALQEERKPYEPAAAPERVLVPLSNPATAPALMDLALLLRPPKSPEPVFVLTVVPESGGRADAYVADAEKMLSNAVAYATGVGLDVRPVTRMDQNFARGIARAMLETRTSTAVIGWDGRTSRQWVFGSVLDQLLELSTQQLVVAKLGHPLSTTRRIVVLVPRWTDYDPGFPKTAAALSRLATGLTAELVLVVVKADPAPYLAYFSGTKPAVPVSARPVTSWIGALSALQELRRQNDLVAVLSARPQTVAWHASLERIPARLAALVPESFLVIYPPVLADAGRAVAEEGAPRLLPRARVVSRIAADSPAAALDALLAAHYPEGRRAELLRAVQQGERGSAMGVAPGVVLFHARLDAIEAAELYLGRSPAGVMFPGLEKAHLVFLLLSPADRPGEHLAALAEVARVLASPARVEALRTAATAADVRAVLAAPDREPAAAPPG
jgi:Kef-type K+ transport system membrane component KefB/mannitol/fructose-specific phosphotransferase system IIA component (Ntr-type)